VSFSELKRVERLCKSAYDLQRLEFNCEVNARSWRSPFAITSCVGSSASRPALPHQKSYSTACSTGGQDSWRDSLLKILAAAMAHGSLLLASAPPAFPRGGLVFSACRAGACGFVMADSVRGAAAALPEDVAAAPFGIGNQPGQDLLPLSRKGIFMGTPPAQDPFSPLLLSGQGVEPSCRIGDTPLGKNDSCNPSSQSVAAMASATSRVEPYFVAYVTRTVVAIVPSFRDLG
jgi:hypothetical protein